MKILLFTVAALGGYLIAVINPAIALSRAIYKKDIRECGSGNPGFTNFKRTFGSSLAWAVMALDLLKSALPCLAFAIVFDVMWGEWQLGAAYTCLFSMLGHAFPVWYGFKGGKGFLVCLSAMWIFNPLVGLAATAVMAVLLFATKYMSLATMLGLLTALCVMPLIGIESVYAFILSCASVLFMIIRHRKNIARLFRGTEAKIYIFGKKKEHAVLDTAEEK